MVRLRTERWYSADGQRRSHARVTQQVGGSRRLLSLCFLLALVVMLMQKATDPRHISNAFQALGVPLDDTLRGANDQSSGSVSERDGRLVNIASDNNSTDSNSTDSNSSATAWDVTCRDLTTRLLDDLTDAEIIELAKSWFAPVAESQLTSPGLSLSQWSSLATSKLDALADTTRRSNIAEDEKEAWLQRIDEFQTQWQHMGDQPNQHQLSLAISPELQTALSSYLDQRLLELLHDATPWTKLETVPFWRLLQRAESRGGDAPIADQSASTVGAHDASPSSPLVNSLQLTAEAVNLRGTTVRFRGSVRRVEHIQRSYPPLSITGYWIVWLRGQDEALQPVAVYTLDEQAARLAQRLDPNSRDYPEIEVQAICGKRLAYAAEAGLQVAPTLFASKLTLLMSPALATHSTDSKVMWSQFLLAVVGACVLAAVIMIPILWQQRGGARAGRSMGRLRSSGSNRGVLQSAGVVCAALVSLVVLLLTNALSLDPRELVSQVKPPWASGETDDPLREIFVDNMQSLFDQAALVELREYQTKRAGEFPDALLQAIYATRRIGWPRALELPQAVSLVDQVVLQPQVLEGWVRLTTPVVLSEAQRNWFQADEQAQLYRVELQPASNLFDESPTALDEPASDATELLTIYCEQVPRMWLTSPQLRQPAQFSALVINDGEQGAIGLCGLAAQPRWLLPREVDATQLAPALPEHYLALGKQGWDLTNFDSIADHQQQSLSSDEADGFYSLLRIVGTHSKPSGSVTDAATRPLEILAHAKQSVGEEVSWPVRIVSGTLVDVDDPRHRRLLGADSYIQFDGFVDIGTDRIRFQPASKGQLSTALEFEGEFPVTIVSSLDSTLATTPTLSAGARSWSVGKYANVQGRFYRMWSYQSELVKSSGQAARQIAPLIVAARLVPTPAPVRGQSAQIGWFGWALCAATLLILAGILRSAVGNQVKRRRVSQH